MKGITFVRRLAWVVPKQYLLSAMFWIAVTVVPLGSGLILQQLFDHIGDIHSTSMREPLWLCAAFVCVELLRNGAMVLAYTPGLYWWHAAVTVLRSNILRSLFTSPGPAASRLPATTGEAVSRLRDDVDDVTGTTDNTVPLFGSVLFGIGAIVIMVATNPLMTVVLVLPMLAIGILSRLVGARVRQLHQKARRQAAEVTSYIGDIFGGVLAIKTTGGAEDAAIERLQEKNERRRNIAIRDRLVADLLNSSTAASVQVSIGLVLLLASSAMRTGSFTVGDLALFTTYVGWLTMLPTVLAEMAYRLPQVSVATERLDGFLSADQSVEELPLNRGIWLRSDPPPLHVAHGRHSDRLQILEAIDLSARFGVSERGIEGVSIRLPKGSKTVITGAIGSGKTTLLRAILGLIPITSGSLKWNGRTVQDPSTFLIPPRAAYVGQTPRLFSDSLYENITLGRDTTDALIERAMDLAVFAQDFRDMPDGLYTEVGSRGVRLSGGQKQRVVMARALIHSPDLIILDDLSSALDVQTEKLMWERVAATQTTQTMLMVSHRRRVLESADQIVVLDRGRVVGVGPLPRLLDNCPEMQRLWASELLEEST